jgi:transposase
MMSKQTRRKYTKEFKHEAVGLVVDQGYCKAEAGRSLGIDPDLIRCWQREFEADGSHAFPGQGKLPPDQQRIRDLENENRRLRRVKDILKKATAFFVQEKS